MKEYLLIMWLATGNGAGLQMEMVTRQQCYAVVQIYQNLDSPVRATCAPPHSYYKTKTGYGGVVLPVSSFDEVKPSEDDPVDAPQPSVTAPSRKSGLDDDRKAP